MKTAVGIAKVRAVLLSELRRTARDWAKAKRKAAFAPRDSSARLDEQGRFYKLLGAESLAHTVGLKAWGYDAELLNAIWRLCRRRDRIIQARILHRPGERRVEAWFVQQWEGQPPASRAPLAELLKANRDAEDLCDWLARAKPGDVLHTGGGAAPACTLRRVS